MTQALFSAVVAAVYPKENIFPINSEENVVAHSGLSAA